MKLLVAILALTALASPTLAKKDKKQQPGTCTVKQEYDMACSDDVAPNLGINTIAVCRNELWHILHACPAKHFCTSEPDPHCWTGNPVGDEDDDDDDDDDDGGGDVDGEGFVRGSKETEEYFWSHGLKAGEED